MVDKLISITHIVMLLAINIVAVSGIAMVVTGVYKIIKRAIEEE